MLGYILLRVLWLIPTAFAVLLITFLIMHATPGGPWDATPVGSDPRLIEQLNRRFGLDKPLFFNPEAAAQATAEGSNLLQVAQAYFDSQFFNYLNDVAHGDFGPSYRFRGRSVQSIILEPPENKPVWQSRLGTTVFLGIVAMAFALLIGLPLGIVSGLKHNSFLDHASLFVATVGYGIPNFILGIFFIIIFAVWLGVVQVLDFDYWDRWQSWILPALTLAIPTAAYIARLTRSSLIEVMNQDYIRTARAKGLREESVVLGHAMRNALIPVVTFIGPAFAALVAGSFIIETQFSVNGIGQLFVDSIGRRDYTVILALTLFYALLIGLANLTVDVIYGWLDPRIRMGGGNR